MIDIPKLIRKGYYNIELNPDSAIDKLTRVNYTK